MNGEKKVHCKTLRLATQNHDQNKSKEKRKENKEKQTKKKKNYRGKEGDKKKGRKQVRSLIKRVNGGFWGGINHHHQQ